MKIALVTDAWIPQVNGVVTTLVELVKELTQLGHDVLVVHPGCFKTRPCPGYAGIDLAIRPQKGLSRLLDAYERIRKGATNGLAVVPIDREASAGSFIHIPPQKQMDVAARKKVIIDEHSGRILVDSILAMEQSEKINAMLEKELKK